MFEDSAFKCIVMFGAAAIGLLAWALAKLTAYLGEKVKNEYWKGVVMRTDDAVMNAVKSVYQSFVSGLKDKEKFTEEDKKAAKAMAVQAAKDMMGTKGMEEAAKVLGMDDLKMSDKVEAAVADMKAGK